MKEYNLLVDYGIQGYNVRGNIFYILYKIFKERNEKCSFEVKKI